MRRMHGLTSQYDYSISAYVTFIGQLASPQIRNGFWKSSSSIRIPIGKIRDIKKYLPLSLSIVILDSLSLYCLYVRRALVCFNKRLAASVG